MPTIEELIVAASTVADGSTIEEHLLNLCADGPSVVNPTKDIRVHVAPSDSTVGVDFSESTPVNVAVAPAAQVGVVLDKSTPVEAHMERGKQVGVLVQSKKALDVDVE